MDKLSSFEKGLKMVNAEEIKVELPLVLTYEDIEDIMVCALEGGINYWCSECKITDVAVKDGCASEQIAYGGTIKLYDREEEEWYSLDKEKFLRGVKLWAENPVGCNCLEQFDGKLHIDCCNADAIVCDAIIQYALFGEVLYA